MANEYIDESEVASINYVPDSEVTISRPDTSLMHETTAVGMRGLEAFAGLADLAGILGGNYGLPMKMAEAVTGYKIPGTPEPLGQQALGTMRSYGAYDPSVRANTNIGKMGSAAATAIPGMLTGVGVVPTMVSAGAAGLTDIAGGGPMAQLAASLVAGNVGSLRDIYRGGVSRLGNWWSKPAVDPSALQDPNVQRGLQYLGRQGEVLNKAPEEITSIGRNTAQGLNRIGQMADDTNLDMHIAAKLGASSGKSRYERAIAEEFKDGLPEIKKSNFLNQLTPDDGTTGILGKVGSRLKQINSERELLANQLDSVFESVNDPNTLPRHMTGAITPISPEILEARKVLNSRIADLELSSLSRPIANSIKSTMNEILNDLAPQPNKFGVTRPMTPSVNIKMQRDLNEVRKNLLQEFDSNQVGAALQGNTPKSKSDLEASIEAISTIQRGLKRGLEDQVGDLANASGMKIKKDVFTRLNDEYGALKAMEKLAEKFQFGTEELLANKGASLIQNPGAQQELSLMSPSIKMNVLQTGLNKLNSMRDAPSPGMRQLGIPLDRESNAIKDIQDLLYFNKNPINLPPAQPPGAMPTDQMILRNFPQLLQALSR